MKLDHLCLSVRDVAKSRDWYHETLGLEVEFELPERKFAALKDESDFGLLLLQGAVGSDPTRIQISFQVKDVDELYSRLAARGVKFDHPPEKRVWGYGPQLTDPDGYILQFYDFRSISPPK